MDGLTDWDWPTVRVELLALLSQVTPAQAHEILVRVCGHADEATLAAVLAGTIRGTVDRNRDERRRARRG